MNTTEVQIRQEVGRDEAMRLLSCGRVTLARLRHRGEIGHRAQLDRNGDVVRYLYDVASIEAWKRRQYPRGLRGPEVGR